MKNTILLFFTLVFVCFSHNPALAQEKQKAKVSLIKQAGNTVTVTITSNEEFYIGGNTHILHIGNKHYDRNEQNNIDGKGILKFFIPANEFKALKNGTKMYLSYGQLDTGNEQEMDAFSKDKESRCWALGKLNKKMLTTNPSK